jgi:hypothetical protein
LFVPLSIVIALIAAGHFSAALLSHTVPMPAMHIQIARLNEFIANT